MTNHSRSIVSQVLLAFTLLAFVVLLASPSNAFAQEPKRFQRNNGRESQATATTSNVGSSSSTCLNSTPQSPENQQSQTNKPDLVKQDVFKAAIDRVQDEIEAQYRAQLEIEPSPEGERWLAERAQAREEDQKYVFLVGKLDVDLPIDTQPELDLTESIGPLVLVTNVWGRTAEATGMQSFDTITKVSVKGNDDAGASFEYKTKGTPLQETAGALTAAAQHAISTGKTDIQLEVQRLIKGYYAPEDKI
ncbi:unnamed protein product [Pseudo-nitzschia multistriata]|uniref:Uncharacterized protein n=1 Tax=Pseudo-nitzschia multistriata TaxID=183589 RepID=A0A448ZAB5_9STRA|nr:unnamed protein product [Pseudo-nitzschia multistriata]